MSLIVLNLFPPIGTSSKLESSLQAIIDKTELTLLSAEAYTPTTNHSHRLEMSKSSIHCRSKSEHEGIHVGFHIHRVCMSSIDKKSWNLGQTRMAFSGGFLLVLCATEWAELPIRLHLTFALFAVLVCLL